MKHDSELMARLAVTQNHEANVNQDIMTFTVFFETREQLLSHVEYYEARAAAYVAPKRRRRKLI
jgi:hypothetical protein